MTACHYPIDAGSMYSSARLSPTPRTTVVRGAARADLERASLHATLAEGLFCHLGVVIDDVPRVVPTAYGVDQDGPDRDGTLYLHGSVAARSLGRAPGQAVCVTVTLLDGLVLARSGFHHSMNYRSAVIVAVPRLVVDPEEKIRALGLIVDQAVPGRSTTLRPHTRKELAATTVLALALHEASVKRRTGDPVDDEADIEAAVWAGLVPVQTVRGRPVRSADCPDDIPLPPAVAALGGHGR